MSLRTALEMDLVLETARLRKALQDVRFIAEDPIGLTERQQIQKVCNDALSDRVGRVKDL